MRSTYRIKKIFAKMLQDKLANSSAVTADDMVAKRDIMSLLVRARVADKGECHPTVSDSAMMNQVASLFLCVTGWSGCRSRTLLGVGHK